MVFLGELRNGAFSEVKAQVKGRKIDTPVDFRLIRRAHEWQVYDVVIDGASIVSNYRSQFTSAPAAKKLSYDLACMISSFLQYQPVEEIVKIAKKYYHHRYIQAAADYIELIQMRPDIHFTDETKQQLLRLLKGKQRRYRKKKSH